jgi:2-dehydropantoate 2-reductase
MKAYDVSRAIADLKRCPTFSPRAALVAMQNGLGSEEAFAEAFGADRVIAGTLTSPVSLDGPNAVHLQRDRGGVALSPLSPPPLNGGGWEGVASTFEAAPLLHAERCANWRSLKWSKLLLNLVGNATGAVLNCTVSEILASDAYARIEMHMLREAERVMRAQGIALVDLPGAPVALFAQALRWLPDPLLRLVLKRFFAKARGDKRPSFYYDALNQSGRSEVDWLNGAVSRHGSEVGVPTPVNDALTRLLLEIVAGERPMGDAGAARELAALVI